MPEHNTHEPRPEDAGRFDYAQALRAAQAEQAVREVNDSNLGTHFGDEERAGINRIAREIGNEAGEKPNTPDNARHTKARVEAAREGMDDVPTKAEMQAMDQAEAQNEMQWFDKASEVVNIIGGLTGDPSVQSEYGSEACAKLDQVADDLSARVIAERPNAEAFDQIKAEAYAAIDRLLVPPEPASPVAPDRADPRPAAEPDRVEAARDAVKAATREAGPPATTPERSRESVLDPEYIGKTLSAGTVEINGAFTLSRAEQVAYKEAAQAAGRQIRGDIDRGDGWRRLTDIPDGSIPPPGLQTLRNGEPRFEGINLTPRTKDDADKWAREAGLDTPIYHDELVPGGPHEPSVRVAYNYTNTPGKEDFNELGAGYVEYSKRPNKLTVSFDVPESVAKQIADAAENDPETVRAIIDKVVKGTGMPETVWTDEGYGLKPKYPKEPVPGYKMSVNTPLKPDWE